MDGRDVGAALDGERRTSATVRWGYALAVVPVALAAAYWLLAVATSLSFTTRAVLLFGLVVALAAVGETATGGPTTVGSYVAAIGSFAAFANLAIVGHGLGRLGQVVVLASPPAALLAARSAERRTDARVVPRLALVALGVLAVAGVALVGYDVAGAGVHATETDYDRASVGVVDDRDGDGTDVRRVPLVRVELRNEFAFSRSVALPEYRFCVAGDDAGRIANAWVDGTGSRSVGGWLTGRPEARAYVEADVRLRGDPGETIEVGVERGRGCDVDPERPTLVFWRERAS